MHELDFSLRLASGAGELAGLAPERGAIATRANLLVLLALVVLILGGALWLLLSTWRGRR